MLATDTHYNKLEIGRRSFITKSLQKNKHLNKLNVS